VATAINPDPAANDLALRSCMQEWFNVPGGAFQAAVLLDARSYRPPAPLDAKQLARLARNRGRAFAARVARLAQQPIPIQPLTVARRVGPAWLLVLHGGNLTQEIRLLNQLTITRLRLR
jgi:hypothetical protein